MQTDEVLLQKYRTQSRSIREKLAALIKERDDYRYLIKYNANVSSISQEEIDTEYLPEIIPVEKCMGPTLSRSEFVGTLVQPRAVHHMEFTLYVALRALESMNANPKSWQSASGDPKLFLSDEQLDTLRAANKSPDAPWRILWCKTLFRCVLSLPIGYLVSHTHIGTPEKRSDGNAVPRVSWCPSSIDYDQFVSQHGNPVVSRSAHVFAARQVSFATYLRLFDRAPADIPMLSLCEADFFSDLPNSTNPLYMAFHEAMKHVFYDRMYLQVPYWWSVALNHHFIRDTDYKEIDYVITKNLGIPWNNVVVSDDIATAEKTSDFAEAEQPESHTDAPIAEELSPKQPPKLSGISSNAVSVVHERISAGAFKANCKGAVFQKVRGRLYLVVPIFFQSVATALDRPNMKPNEIHESFVKDGLLGVDSVDAPEHTFEIRPRNSPSRLGKVRALPVSEEGQRVLLPPGVVFEDNDDLRPMKKTAIAGAA